MTAYNIRIERNELVLPNHICCSLLKPRLRSQTGGEQTGFAVIPVLLNDRLMQDGPQRILSDPRADCGPELRNRDLGRVQGCHDAFDIFVEFNGTGHSDGFPGVDNPET